MIVWVHPFHLDTQALDQALWQQIHAYWCAHESKVDDAAQEGFNELPSL